MERPSEAAATIAVTVAAIALYIDVRWMFFSGMRRAGERVVVTGLLWSRSIPLRQIDAVNGGYAAIHWRTRHGMRVVTPLLPFWSNPNPAPFLTRHNAACLKELRTWVRENHVDGPPRWMDRV
ncbi:hypothetical protein GCM10027406_01330 [Leifsonia lichenia]